MKAKMVNRKESDTRLSDMERLLSLWSRQGLENTDKYRQLLAEQEELLLSRLSKPLSPIELKLQPSLKRIKLDSEIKADSISGITSEEV